MKGGSWPGLPDLMENTDIKAAIMMMYGPILEKYEDNKEINSIGLVLVVLASVVYHGACMTYIVSRQPGHPFSLIPLLNSQELLNKL